MLVVEAVVVQEMVNVPPFAAIDFDEMTMLVGRCSILGP